MRKSSRFRIEIYVALVRGYKAAAAAANTRYSFYEMVTDKKTEKNAFRK